MLEATKFVGAKKGKSYWLVRCDCGVEKEMPGTELTRGRITSCGCNKDKAIGEANTKHGRTHDPLYGVWRSMKQRCESPTHPAYNRYGGRGIVVCPEWHEFSTFLKDMECTYVPGLTLDRIDNSAGYSKENCRWATRVEQARNTRNNVYLNTPKGRMLLEDAAKEFGIGKTTLCYRIAAGWPNDKLFIEPDVRNRL